MKDGNNITLRSYDENIQAYIDGSPQTVDGDLKVWIDTQFSEVNLNAKILEIGSGTGRDARYLESKGFTVQRTDASEGFIELLRSQGEGVKLLNILTDEIGEEYDVIFADAVFLHFTEEQLKQVFKKAYHALSEDGKLLFTLKEGEGEEVTNSKLGADRFFKYWKEEPIKAVLDIVGFSSAIEGCRKGRQGWLHVSAQKRTVK